MRPRWKVQRLTDWNRIKGRYGRGMKVRAVVRSHQGFGLVCDVDGSHVSGVVRNREISWSLAKQTAATIPIGEFITSVVIGYDEDWRELQLSIKGAEPGPFERFADTHAVGQVLEASVAQIIPQGYVLSLEGDVEAVLPHGEVPFVSSLCKQHIAEADALLKGDDVKVVLTGVDRAAKTISVSLVAFVRKLSEQTKSRIKEAMARRDGKGGSSAALDTRTAPERRDDRPCRTLSILIVEDNEVLLSQLVPMLKARGHSVFTARGSAEAQKAIQAPNHLDVVLLDLQLQDGLAHANGWLRQLHSKFENVAVYLFTANVGVLLAGSGFSPAAHVDGLIQKPADASEIIAVIEGELPARPFVETTPEPADPTARSAAQKGIILAHGIEEYFNALQRVWEGCRPTLLAYDPESAQVKALRVRNVKAEEINSRSGGLARSPVGNALADKRAIEEHLHSTSAEVLKDVLKSLNADRVYGFPLHVFSGRQAMGLFVFSPPVRHGEDGYDDTTDYVEIERNMAMISHEMSVAIERARLEEEMQRQQRATCVGNLILGMAHEIRNNLQTLETFRHNIEFAIGPQSAYRQASPGIVLDALGGMRGQIASLRDTLEMFLGMARVSKAEKLPLGELLRDTVRACGNSALQWNVVVNLAMPEDIQYPFVPTTLRQAFMNLMLNAVQHSAYAPVDRGLVEVSVEPVQAVGMNFIDVRVRDNGLGVHRCHRAQMFEMFFTTRKDGTGLGLYVTAKILEAIGATVEVEESYRYGGTTFRVRIPVPETN